MLTRAAGKQTREQEGTRHGKWRCTTGPLKHKEAEVRLSRILGSVTTVICMWELMKVTGRMRQARHSENDLGRLISLSMLNRQGLSQQRPNLQSLGKLTDFKET